MASTQSSLQVFKTFTYRGQSKLWSNRYFLNNVPPDNAHWTTLSDTVVSDEHQIYDSGVTITKTVGRNAGSEIPVFTKTYSTVGVLAGTGGQKAPGDVAALIRYNTTQRTSKNHPLYLFNYYHSAWLTLGTNADSLLAAYATALGTYANQWVSGISDGTTTYKKTGPHGAVAQGYTVESFLTHRDFR